MHEDAIACIERTVDD